MAGVHRASERGTVARQPSILRKGVRLMLKWLKKYYIGKGVSKVSEARSRINAGKPAPGIFLVTLSDSPENILEIIPAVLLVYKKLYDSCPMIVGMAGSKSDAILLVQKIIETVYKKTGGFDAETYLLEHRN